MWMQELDDIALLREFAERDSEPAFAELVARHVNKIYSVALRHARNPHQAEEITQAVFVILARKARRLGPKVVLSGWLYQTARLAAVTFIRSEIRRAQREQEAVMQTSINANESDVWPQIAPLLDEALAGLGEKDRNAVVLRFFDGKSMKEIGATLGGSEDAAKMRVNRAVEKLRNFFSKHGVALTSAAMIGAVSVNSVQAAPVGLAKSAASVATAKGSIAAASTLALVKGTMKIMTWIKVKTAIGVATGALLVAGTATVTVSTLLRAQEPPHTTPVSVTVPTTAMNNPIVSPNLPAPTPQEIPARVAAPVVPQSRPKAAVVAPQIPPSKPIYPTAPTVSEILAASRAAGGVTGGIVTFPPDLYFLNQYGNLFQKLKLTPDQITAFMKIMEDKQAQKGDFMRANALDPGILAGLTGDQIATVQQEHFQQMQLLMQPIDQAADSQVRQILGSDGFNYYQTYNAQQKERAVIMNGYREGLNTAGVPPLTLDQDEQLVNLVYQARIGANNDPDAEAQQFPQVVQQASAFLTANQIKVFEQYMPPLLSPTNDTAVGSVIGVMAPAQPGN